MSIQITKESANLYKLYTSIKFNKPVEEIFDFFCKAENLEKITPPYLNFKILTPLPIVMNKSALIDYKISLNKIPMKWRTLISEWNPTSSFTDTQIKGPYLKWEHTHKFTPINENLCKMEDIVYYSVPGGAIINFLFVEKKLREIFSYRKEIMLELFSS